MLALAFTIALLAAPQTQTCGTKSLYGKELTIRVHGKGVTCEQVAEITAGECDVDGSPWFCFSSWAPGPALFWAKEKERFEEEPSVWIEAVRRPCSESKVTAAAWKRARAQTGDAFPREEQLLADDLVRCKQLKGKRYASIRKLLGKPDEKSTRALAYELGDERDSFFQLDSESLSLQFDRRGVLRSAELTQN